MEAVALHVEPFLNAVPVLARAGELLALGLEPAPMAGDPDERTLRQKGECDEHASASRVSILSMSTMTMMRLKQLSRTRRQVMRGKSFIDDCEAISVKILPREAPTIRWSTGDECLSRAPARG